MTYTLTCDSCACSGGVYTLITRCVCDGCFCASGVDETAGCFPKHRARCKVILRNAAAGLPKDENPRDYGLKSFFGLDRINRQLTIELERALEVLKSTRAQCDSQLQARLRAEVEVVVMREAIEQAKKHLDHSPDATHQEMAACNVLAWKALRDAQAKL